VSALKKQEQEEREFLFTRDDFVRIKSLIYRHAGISLSDAKTDMVYSRIGRRLRALDMQSFKHYLDALEHEFPAQVCGFVRDVCACTPLCPLTAAFPGSATVAPAQFLLARGLRCSRRCGFVGFFQCMQCMPPFAPHPRHLWISPPSPAAAEF
jgi:hypothetical protein